MVWTSSHPHPVPRLPPPISKDVLGEFEHQVLLTTLRLEGGRVQHLHRSRAGAAHRARGGSGGGLHRPAPSRGRGIRDLGAEGTAGRRQAPSILRGHRVGAGTHAGIEAPVPGPAAGGGRTARRVHGVSDRDTGPATSPSSSGCGPVAGGSGRRAAGIGARWPAWRDTAGPGHPRRHRRRVSPARGARAPPAPRGRGGGAPGPRGAGVDPVRASGTDRESGVERIWSAPYPYRPSNRRPGFATGAVFCIARCRSPSPRRRSAAPSVPVTWWAPCWTRSAPRSKTRSSA